ncbi:hypothetical protein N7481_011311 [Penicillium waksmanii]|uniref:uncharacterized protein n=1 Tax=Penicillium waksmanii TaxID=69791 RepID=UPI0025479A71|nr:uncharacterized protein N7481_011311 [Penicillium waksmanii]KAJ5974101.1 hypothetical protein N7481_011311 [Penicillium waksmanii]
MFRPAVRALARAPIATPCGPASRRLISTGPTKSRSWKNTVLRLGLAGGAIYYYNTSSAFSKEPQFSILAKTQQDNANASSETLDSITPKIREERAAARKASVNPEELEKEAGQEAAFNPETGEINWDCPCLGGMAHGPCGEEFKAAFSCFVYSEEEPKGIDCIEKFQGMQNCFRAHPDVYGAELEDEEEAEAAEAGAPAPAPSSERPAAVAADIDAPSQSEVKADEAEKVDSTEPEFLVPKAAHDAETKNQEAQKTEN